MTQRGGGACVDSGEVFCAHDPRAVSGDGGNPGGDFPGWADRRGSSDSVVINWVGGSVVGVSDVPGGVHTGGEPVVQGSCRGSVSALVWFVVWGGGESSVRPLPPVALTPRPTGLSPHVGETDADGGRLGLPDLSREGPFDVHQDRWHAGMSVPDDIVRRGTQWTGLHACIWGPMWVCRSRLVCSAAAQNTGCTTWEENKHFRPLYNYNMTLG